MKKFKLIVTRLAHVLPILLIVSVMAFALSNMSAGDVAEVTLRSQGLTPTPEAIAAVREELGLNNSLPQQYVLWAGKALRGDFGVSFQTGRPVTEEIMAKFPATLMLSLAATLLSVLFAVPVALLSVRYKDSVLDHSFRVFTTAGATMPDFCLALILLYVFAIQLQIAPVISGSDIRNIFLPALALSVGYGVMYARVLRNNLIEIRNCDYMRAARARGLGETQTLVRHGLRNAALPCMALIGVNFGKLLGGQFVCEMIFSWNGIGKFAVDSIKLKDLPVIQGYIIIVAAAYILINLVLDILYLYIDPRISIE
jgi:ABC-type dipeptide/oligopeptide/nickel transport systems, permease components